MAGNIRARIRALLQSRAHLSGPDYRGWSLEQIDAEIERILSTIAARRASGSSPAPDQLGPKNAELALRLTEWAAHREGERREREGTQVLEKL